MKIQGADLRAKDRKPLQDVVPLDTPLSCYIEPSNVCNIHCQFCPTGYPDLIKSVNRAAGVMTANTFRKVVSDLASFPRKISTINIYKDGESLVNKNLPDMAKALRPYCDKLYIKTNGLLLTPELSDRLVASGLDMIGISVIAPHAEGYKRVAWANVDYDKFVGNIRYLFEHRVNTKIYIKMANVNFSEAEIAKFYADFEPISDYIAVENLHGWSRTDLKDFTLGTHPDSFDGVPNSVRVACAWPLYQMTVNWNGTVQPCNEDWSWVNVMGDIHEQTLKEIWNGDKFVAFRKMQLRGERFANKACGSCWQTMSCLDNVDPYREQILENIK